MEHGQVLQGADASDEPLVLRDQVVLIVDDEVDIRDSLKELLDASLDGLRVLTAESGSSALDLLRQQPVDLIVTDYKMPGMSGMELLAEARRVSQNVPRVLMTAFPDLDLAIRAVNEERVENFFTKPLEPAAVVDVVRGILEDRRSHEMRSRAFARSIHLLRRKLEPDDGP